MSAENISGTWRQQQQRFFLCDSLHSSLHACTLRLTPPSVTGGRLLRLKGVLLQAELRLRRPTLRRNLSPRDLVRRNLGRAAQHQPANPLAERVPVLGPAPRAIEHDTNKQHSSELRRSLPRRPVARGRLDRPQLGTHQERHPLGVRGPRRAHGLERRS